MPTPLSTSKAVEYTAAAGGALSQVRDVSMGWKAFADRMQLQSLYKKVKAAPSIGLALGAIEGSAKSVGDTYSGRKEEWFRDMGAQSASPWQAAGLDTLRTLGDVGNAITFNQAGRLGELLSNIR